VDCDVTAAGVDAVAVLVGCVAVLDKLSITPPPVILWRPPR